MFSQVVGTILRLTQRHADAWLAVQGSHTVPVYGFERYADPPPLDVDVIRLLETFARGRVTSAEAWSELVGPELTSSLIGLADEAAVALDEATRADTPTWVDEAEFRFPDELWARIFYRIAVSARNDVMPIDAIVASLVPIYFARVASLVLESMEMTSEQAEALVERQARAFEMAKPGLVERWQATESPAPKKRRKLAAAAKGTASKSKPKTATKRASRKKKSK
jgi:hypothetical protein